MSILEAAKSYAIYCHKETNHHYDDHPYSFHLKSAYDYANKFIHLVDEEDRQDVLASCWTHDLIEDCRQTYNDVKKNCNEVVAEITYALTNEKGKNRKERENDKYFEGIKKIKNASFVKICDRLANISYSKQTCSGMFGLYKNEYDEFKRKLYEEKYKDMFVEIDYLLFDKRYEG